MPMTKQQLQNLANDMYISTSKVGLFLEGAGQMVTTPVKTRIIDPAVKRFNSAVDAVIAECEKEKYDEAKEKLVSAQKSLFDGLAAISPVASLTVNPSYSNGFKNIVGFGARSFGNVYNISKRLSHAVIGTAAVTTAAAGAVAGATTAAAFGTAYVATQATIAGSALAISGTLLGVVKTLGIASEQLSNLASFVDRKLDISESIKSQLQTSSEFIGSNKGVFNQSNIILLRKDTDLLNPELSKRDRQELKTKIETLCNNNPAAEKIFSGLKKDLLTVIADAKDAYGDLKEVNLIKINGKDGVFERRLRKISGLQGENQIKDLVHDIQAAYSHAQQNQETFRMQGMMKHRALYTVATIGDTMAAFRSMANTLAGKAANTEKAGKAVSNVTPKKVKEVEKKTVSAVEKKRKDLKTARKQPRGV